MMLDSISRLRCMRLLAETQPRRTKGKVLMRDIFLKRLLDLWCVYANELPPKDLMHLLPNPLRAEVAGDFYTMPQRTEDAVGRLMVRHELRSTREEVGQALDPTGIQPAVFIDLTKGEASSETPGLGDEAFKNLQRIVHFFPGST